MIDKSLANDVLTAALDSGADFAEIFIENDKKNTILLINGLVDKAQSGIDFGLGLRIIKNDRVVYSYTNDLSADNLINCAKNAAKAFTEEKKR